MNPPMSALDTALQALELGLSPVPPVEDGSKRPLADIPDGVDDSGKPKFTWKPYQTTPATAARVRSWFTNGRKSIGLATGVNGLECLEFDCRVTYDDFLEAASEAGLGELVDRIRTGYEEFTPGGGVHWLYYCDELRGNTKLASRLDPWDPDKQETLIETRGEGGFIIIAPSNGTVHPTGGAYKLVLGRLTSISTLGGWERDELWELARTFDEIAKEPEADPDPDPDPWPMTATGDRSAFPKQGIRPGDDFATRTRWEEILEPAGWVKAFTRRRKDLLATAWQGSRCVGDNRALQGVQGLHDFDVVRDGGDAHQAGGLCRSESRRRLQGRGEGAGGKRVRNLDRRRRKRASEPGAERVV